MISSSAVARRYPPSILRAPVDEHRLIVTLEHAARHTHRAAGAIQRAHARVGQSTHAVARVLAPWLYALDQIVAVVEHILWWLYIIACTIITLALATVFVLSFLRR